MENKKSKLLIEVIGIVFGILTVLILESHIINVSAQVAPVLAVNPGEIAFGVVFPQEKLYKSFTISIIDPTTDDVTYVIKHKPKPRNPADAEYCHLNSPQNPADPSDPYYVLCYPDLCKQLSEMPDGTPANDTGLQAPHPPEAMAYGYLSKVQGDTRDDWTVDLVVPCFEGMCDQGYNPAIFGASLPATLEGQNFGCDLWVEVTGTSVRFPETGNAYIGYEDWYDGDFDYNDFGMNFETEELYNFDDQLTNLKMTFKAMIYDSGADHYIHIKRPLNGNYNYTVTRSGSAYTGEIATGGYAGSGLFDVVLFNTGKYTWPQKQINETVTINIVLTNPELNPKTALVPPRWDVSPIMANYDPWEDPYSPDWIAPAAFHINQTQTISSTANQKNTPEIIPVGTTLPFILVVPFTDWIPPYEDTTITGPYQYFDDYYISAGALYPDWYIPGNVRPGHNVVGAGSLSWGPY